MPLAIDLINQVVLVTGGSRGIGAAAVRLLHEAGANVFFTYRTDRVAAEKLAAVLRDRVAFAQCDVGDASALPALVHDCIQRFGKIDTLVNNAAIFEENAFDSTNYGEWQRGWQRTFAVNLFGAANLAWLVMTHMRKQKHGRIVNVVSRAAHRGELTFADYGASKAALVNLTKSIARACASDGITAVAIAPGFIETDMAAPDLQTHRAEIVAEIPMGRVGTAEEVAQIIVFACSPLATYANGATIDINGASYVR